MITDSYFLQQTTEGEIQIQSHVVVPPPDTGSLCVTEPPDLSANITLSQDTGKFMYYLVSVLWVCHQVRDKDIEATETSSGMST